MKLTDLTAGHLGQHITLRHGKTVVSGQLQSIDPVFVYDYQLCQNPDEAEGYLTGFELIVGGWVSPTINPGADVEVIE